MLSIHQIQELPRRKERFGLQVQFQIQDNIAQTPSMTSTA
jgi:hypothetical protein